MGLVSHSYRATAPVEVGSPVVMKLLTADANRAAVFAVFFGEETQTLMFSTVPDDGGFSIRHPADPTNDDVIYNALWNEAGLATNLQFWLHDYPAYAAATVTGDFTTGLVFTFIGVVNPPTLITLNNTLETAAVPVDIGNNGSSVADATIIVDGTMARQGEVADAEAEWKQLWTQPITQSQDVDLSAVLSATGFGWMQMRITVTNISGVLSLNIGATAKS